MANKSPNFIQRVKDSFNYIWNANQLQYTPLLATGPGMFYAGSAINWNISWAETFENNEIVYQALRVYLKKAKVAPIMLSKVIDEKALRKYHSFEASTKNQEHRVLALQQRRKALEEVESHSILDLFDNPNNYQTQSQLLEAWYGYWKLSGDGFLYGGDIPQLGVNKGKPKSLHVLPSQWVTIVYSGNWMDPIAGYKLDIDGQTIPIPKENVCHLYDWNPSSRFAGLSPVVAGKKILKTDDYNKTAQSRAYENGGKAVMISSDSENEDFQWTEEQAKLVDRKIQEKLQGAHNYGNIFSVTRPAKVQAIGDSVGDQRLIESAKFNRPVIPNLFGVDSVLIGDKENGTENNVASARKSLVTDTIVPDHIVAKEILNKWLRPAFGKEYYIDFDTTVYSELQPDLKLMMEVFGAPLLTNNERRNLFNYDNFDNVEWGDAVFVNSGQERIESVLSTGSDINQADQQVEEAMKRYGY